MNNRKYYVVWKNGSKDPEIMDSTPPKGCVYLMADDTEEAIRLSRRNRPTWEEVVSFNDEKKSKHILQKDRSMFSRAAMTRRNHGHR